MGRTDPVAPAAAHGENLVAGCVRFESSTKHCKVDMPVSVAAGSGTAVEELMMDASSRHSAEGPKKAHDYAQRCAQ